MSQHTRHNAYACEGSLALSIDRSRFRVIEGGRPSSHGRTRTAHSASFPSTVTSPSHELTPSILRHRQLVIMLTIALVMLLVTGSWLIGDLKASSRVNAAMAQAAHETITVMPGDSLWHIAETHPVESCSTSQLVDYISSTNNLDETPLAVGTILTIPSSL